MATVEELCCRGCGTPVPSGSTGRRLLTGLSSNQMLSAWKDLLREKLNTLNVFVGEEVSKSGYVCRKCFRSFQSFSDMKHTITIDCLSSIDPNFFRLKAGASAA